MAIGKASRTGNVGKRTRITGKVGSAQSRSGSKWGSSSDSRSKVQYPTTTTVAAAVTTTTVAAAVTTTTVAASTTSVTYTVTSTTT